MKNQFKRVAAIGLLACCAMPAGAQNGAVGLGRLFSSPEERAALDSRRDSGTLNADPASASAGAAGITPAATSVLAPAAPAPVTLNGVVRRSNGKSTVWLNQVPQEDGSNRFLPGRGGQRGTAVSLQSSNGQNIILKPGQRYDLNDGSVKEIDAR